MTEPLELHLRDCDDEIDSIRGSCRCPCHNPTWTVTCEGNPPSINATYQIVYHGPYCPTCRRGQPTLGKKPGVSMWQDGVAWQVKAARPSGWKPARRTRIEIEWWTERAGRDADGPMKALLDAIAKGLGCDDQGFLPAVLSCEKDAKNPRTVIRVTNLDS